MRNRNFLRRIVFAGFLALLPSLPLSAQNQKGRTVSGTVYDVTTNWTGRAFKMAIRGVPPTTGNLRIDFHQPEKGLTSGRGLLEGRVFEVPFTEKIGARTHVSLPVIREDFLDGRLELEVNLMTGRALAIDRLRLIPANE